MAAPAGNVGKLVIPPHFISYMEKHRIYELIYDMTSALAINMPADHVLFLKDYLTELGNDRNRPKIFILGPSHINKQGLATAIASALGLEVIHGQAVIDGDKKCLEEPIRLASKLFTYIHSNSLEAKGWILYGDLNGAFPTCNSLDIPRKREELNEMQKLGVTPTHAFLLVPSPEKYTQDDLWNENLKHWTAERLRCLLIDYKTRAIGLRLALKSKMQEVPIRGRTLEQVAQSIAFLSKLSKQPSGPRLPRVVLIGTRGSYRRTVACMLSKKYGIVHVDAEEVVERGKLQQSKLGQEIRDLLSKNVRIYGKYVVALIEDRILDYDCLNKGWVMTGFPRDRTDLEVLDMMDTPPNRIIFITSNSLECLDRLKKRRVNILTGELTTVDELSTVNDEKYLRQFVIHPSDDEKQIVSEQEQFDKNIQGMLDYCKANCSIVSGSGTVEQLYERVSAAMLHPSPAVPVRKPRTQLEIENELTTKRESNEFEVISEVKSVKSGLVKKSSRIDGVPSCSSIFPRTVVKEDTTTSSKK